MIRRLLVIAGAFALVVLPSSAVASDPADSGTLSPPPSGQSTTVTWSGTIPGGVNADSDCSQSTSDALNDHHTATLQLPSRFYAKHTLLAVFTVAPQPPVDDVILTVERKDSGAVLGSSDSSGLGGTETVAMFNPSALTYDALACAFSGGPQPYQGKLTLSTDPPNAPGGKAPGVKAATYVNYKSNDSSLGNDAGEPSIGVDWNTNKANGGTVMFQAIFQTLKVTFDDSTTPASSTWQDVSAPWTSIVGLDPILFTDARNGRTFVSQLTGQDSLSAFSDDDGALWLPSQGGGIPSGVDHQSLGAGPYPAGFLPGPLTSYPNAVYYCSQDLSTAFCARSDTGGLTFGAGIPIYTSECGGLHGHVRVAPDGTVYVPNKSCLSKQGVAVSTNAGQSWTVRTVPALTPGLSDPSVAAGTDNTTYFGFVDGDGHPKITISSDRGVHWTTAVDVGAVFGIQNAVFPEVIAGDGDRAAFAFLGTTTAGNLQAADFGDANHDGVYEGGEWHLYVAITYDRGKTWTTADATPKDPVQRGAICLGGISCDDTIRNLLDFNDITVDNKGRVLAAYADGCIGACVTSTKVADNPHEDIASIARQASGTGLFAVPPAG
jgi:hypothetical protein